MSYINLFTFYHTLHSSHHIKHYKLLHLIILLLQLISTIIRTLVTYSTLNIVRTNPRMRTAVIAKGGTAGKTPRKTAKLNRSTLHIQKPKPTIST